MIRNDPLLRGFQAWLFATGIGILLWSAALFVELNDDWRTLHALDPVRLAAVVLGGSMVALTPFVLLRLARAHKAGGLKFLRRGNYYRALLVAMFGTFVAVLFGPRWEGEQWLALHLFAVLLLHRCLLLVPTTLDRLTAWAGRHRALRALDFAATHVVVIVLLSELALRAAVGLGAGAWLPGNPDPLANKLRAPLFGYEPNSLGYNDREFEPTRTPGQRRIAAIGDSFFVAHVPRPYGVIARTEVLLTERDPARPTEIYNFGILAASPTEYLEILRRDALRLSPNAVLVGIYVGNDIKENVAYAPATNKRAYLLYRAFDALRTRANARDAEREFGFVDLAKISHQERDWWFSPDLVLAVFTDEQYAQTAARHLELLVPETDFRQERQWHDTLVRLDQIAAECEAARVPLLLVIAPDHVQVSVAQRERLAARAGSVAANLQIDLPQKRLARFCAERGIACLDLLPAFHAAARTGNPDHLYLRNDTHWSARGNEVAAAALADWLSSR